LFSCRVAGRRGRRRSFSTHWIAACKRNAGIATNYDNFSPSAWEDEDGYSGKAGRPDIGETGSRGIACRTGAIPDDGLDDTQAVLRALAAANAEKGKVTLHFPKGRTQITEVLHITRSAAVPSLYEYQLARRRR
jgi:hypothetical protein